MRIGLQLPQGYFNEFEGWEPTRAWARILEIATLAERLGFDSLWTGEHVESKWGGESIAFDCFTLATAVGALVPRVEIGFDIINSTFHNPAMTAKRASTLDTITGGRVVLGLGTGFREVEAQRFGYAFPPLRERLAMLTEHLEIVSRMVRAGEAPFSFDGRFARVQDVINNPRSVRAPRIKLLVAGEGPNITMRLAAKYADIFNIGVPVGRGAWAIETVRDRCQEIGRDPATLQLQAGLNPSWPYRGLRSTYGQRMLLPQDVGYLDPSVFAETGTRAEEIATWRELGVDELIVAAPGLIHTDESLHEVIDDLRRAGIELRPPGPASAGSDH